MSYLNIKDVVKRTTLSKATIYRLMKSGDFPQNLKLSPRRVVWCDKQIEEWINRLKR